MDWRGAGKGREGKAREGRGERGRGGESQLSSPDADRPPSRARGPEPGQLALAHTFPRTQRSKVDARVEERSFAPWQREKKKISARRRARQRLCVLRRSSPMPLSPFP